MISSAMPEYRTITVSRHGAIIEAVKFEYANDDEAKARAQSIARYNDVELWQGERKVATITSKDN